MTDDITNDLALLDDWLAGKGYGEEAGLAMRAMDLIRKQADEIEKLRAANKALTEQSWVVDGALLSEREENEKLRAALKRWEDTGLQKDWPITYDENTQGCWLAEAGAAKAALGENDE
jgi:hypothetical protein